MNTNSVCIFPDTMVKAEVVFPLVQVFEPVVYLRPVENDPPVGADLSPLCREMIDKDLVRFDCPAPLLDIRDRFMRLVHDLQNRRDDYANQLSHLSLAGLGNSRKTETKTSIISTLLKQTGIQEEEDEQRVMLLWQARLLLKLGEIFDREQTDLQKNLEQISVREKLLLDDLRKDNKQPFSLSKTITANSDNTDGQLLLRLKAWSRLFALGSHPIATSIFVTTSRDALDLLTEHYESEYNEHPKKILNLQLPGGCESDSFAKQRIAFRDDAADLISAIHRLLENPESINEEELSAFYGADCSWANLLEHHYPSAENGYCTLSLYSLASVDPGRLFIETFGGDKDEGQAQPLTSRDTYSIIGILEENTV